MSIHVEMKLAGHEDGTNNPDEKEHLHADVTSCSTPKRICAVKKTNLIKNLGRKRITHSTKSLHLKTCITNKQFISGSHLTYHFSCKGIIYSLQMWKVCDHHIRGSQPVFCSCSFLKKGWNLSSGYGRSKIKIQSSYIWENRLGVSKISSFP